MSRRGGSTSTPNPEATVELVGKRRAVRGRAAEGDERARLWAHWRDVGDDVAGYAVRRPFGTAVVVLEPLLAAA